MLHRLNSKGQKIIFANREEIEACYFQYLRRINEAQSIKEETGDRTVADHRIEEFKIKKRPKIKNFKASTVVHSFQELNEAMRNRWVA